jgi:hypothetical protein
MKIKMVCAVCMLMVLASGCAINRTHRIEFPPADDLFVTCGDDPGSESNKPYVPKGQFIHVTQEHYLPIPLLGMFVRIGKAEPQHVFDKYIIPRVREMGGDALINAKVNYTPPTSIIWGLFGLRSGGTTVITGQAVKK